MALGKHPAQFNKKILKEIADLASGHYPILDPFAGTGKIFNIRQILGEDTPILAYDIDLGWPGTHAEVKQANALALPLADGSIGCIATSPVYGNRMSDCHEAKDDSRRFTYTHTLGRTLHEDNAGQLQWGPQYRAFHIKFLLESCRVLVPGGIFVLNIKNHIRAKRIQDVAGWWMATMQALGFVIEEERKVLSRGMRYGENGTERIGHEKVIKFVLKHDWWRDFQSG